MSIRILIADDHPIVRKGLVLLLSTFDQFEIIGEAEDGEEALLLSKRLKPDVILMDLRMPNMDGIEATKRIAAECPQTKIMVLTSFSDQDHVLPALEAGASGYQLKESNPDDLVKAIIKLTDGEKQYHPKVTDELIAALKPKENPFHPLTEREKEVLEEITQGKSNKEIAADLFITEKTVKTHVSNILAKLDLQDRTQAALFAVRNGLGTWK